jgi:hypothetical protein
LDMRNPGAKTRDFSDLPAPTTAYSGKNRTYQFYLRSNLPAQLSNSKK